MNYKYNRIGELDMNLKVGNLEAKPGEKVSGFLLIEGTELKVPITLINGVKDGKKLLITAGIHGCEYLGIEAILELAREIEPQNISGGIILVHLANISGFYQRCAAIVPDDGKNLNRVFPGDNKGTASEKIAHIITHELQNQVDFYIDLHGGDLHELTMPFVYYPGIGTEEISKISCEVAKQLSVTYRVRSSAISGAYNSAAICGIPSILIERGGCGLWSKEETACYKEDIYKVLEYLQIIRVENTNKVNEMQQEVLEAVYIDSEHDGYWYPAVKPGDKIEQGQFLGMIRDCFGNEVQRYNSQVKGIVLYMTVSLAIAKGNSLIAYGKLK